jgi:hypothetical protein
MKRFAVQVRITAIHVRVFLGYVRVLGAHQVSRRCPCPGICSHFKTILASLLCLCETCSACDWGLQVPLGSSVPYPVVLKHQSHVLNSVTFLTVGF